MTETDTRWLDLGEFIREQRRIGHLSLRKLSEMAGISNPYLSQIERGLRKPSAEILQQIARALEISSETLYVRAGILDDDRPHDLVSEIRRDLLLTEDQKKAMISIYDSFRAENERRLAEAGVERPGAAVAAPDMAHDADDRAPVDVVEDPDGAASTDDRPAGAEQADDPSDDRPADVSVDAASVGGASLDGPAESLVER